MSADEECFDSESHIRRHLKKIHMAPIINFIIYYAIFVGPLGAIIAQLITITQVFFLSKRRPKLKVIRAKTYLYAAIISNILWQLMWLYQVWFGDVKNGLILSYANDAIGFASFMLIWLLEIEAWRYNVPFSLTPSVFAVLSQTEQAPQLIRYAKIFVIVSFLVLYPSIFLRAYAHINERPDYQEYYNISFIIYAILLVLFDNITGYYLVRKIFAWKAKEGDKVALNRALAYLSCSILLDWIAVIITTIGLLFLSVGPLQFFFFAMGQTIAGILLAILTIAIHLCFFVYSLLNLSEVAVSKLSRKVRPPSPIKCQLQDIEAKDRPASPIICKTKGIESTVDAVDVLPLTQKI